MTKEHEQDDEALLEELARLVERLRSSRYEEVMERAQAASSSVVEDFADLFSRHLLYEEEVLFPALKEPSAPGAGKKLDGLKVEHGKLRGFAMELVSFARQGDRERAADTGRLFMAALLDHIKRESEVTRQILLKLNPVVATHLKSKLGLEGPSSP